MDVPLLADYNTEKFIKRLAGRKDVEDALSRLDTLTKEENLMAAVQNLELTQDVRSKVKVIEEITRGVDHGANCPLI